MPRLTQLGHAAFLLESGGGRLVIDPFMTGSPLARVKPEAIRVDHILLTHGHGDHLGDAPQIAKENGAVIIAPDELAIYCANRIDLALLPIGDNFTMGIEDAVKAAELLQARLYVPMHYKTFEVIDVEPEEFVRAVQAKGLKARLLPIGQTLSY